MKHHLQRLQRPALVALLALVAAVTVVIIEPRTLGIAYDAACSVGACGVADAVDGALYAILSPFFG